MKLMVMTYSPTNGTKWSSLVPAAIGRTQHGRSSCCVRVAKRRHHQERRANKIKGQNGKLQ